MDQEVVFKETYGAFGREHIYIKPQDQNRIVHVQPLQSMPQSFHSSAAGFLRQVFLPYGYPDSVSADYINYQLWDTLQAFCSSVTGTLTTRAIMEGMGVGSADATPLAAAITWILKDGTGMVSSIFFAWWKGTSLDSDSKKWRLVADGVNDAAMCLELLLPFFSGWSTAVLCISTTMKAIVGVAGGATRAAITQHQAVRDNMADISAKDGSQERFVNLAASLTGIILLSTVYEPQFIWGMFSLLTMVHLYANYKAVRALTMTTLNSARLNLILHSYLTHGDVGSIKHVNNQESVIIGFGFSEKHLCGFKIAIGTSVGSALTKAALTFENAKMLQSVFKDQKYLLIPDLSSKTIYVILEHNETTHDILRAYFHAVLLAIGYCISSGIKLKHLSEKFPMSLPAPINRLKLHLNKNEENMSITQIMLTSMEIVSTEFPAFIAALHEKGWSTSSHFLQMDEWRAEWNRFTSSSTTHHTLLL